MKRLLLILFALLPLLAFGQKEKKLNLDSVLKTVPFKEQAIVYEKITDTSLPPAIQMANAKKWIALNFGDYKTVVKLEDEVSKTIILKGVYDIKKGATLIYRYNFTMEMNFKDKKFRLMISDIKRQIFSGLRSLGDIETLEFEVNYQISRTDINKNGAGEVISDFNLIFRTFLERASNNINRNSVEF